MQGKVEASVVFSSPSFSSFPSSSSLLFLPSFVLSLLFTFFLFFLLLFLFYLFILLFLPLFSFSSCSTPFLVGFYKQVAPSTLTLKILLGCSDGGEWAWTRMDSRRP